MRHRLSLVASLAVAAACGSPPPPIPGGPTPQQPPPIGPPLVTTPVRLQPSSLRYVIHRRLRIEQELAGQPPTHMSYRVFVTAAISGPADSMGYAVIHSVDSIVPDSGSFVPPTVNFAAARGLQFSGRVTPWGAVVNAQLSDTASARFFLQFVGGLQEFYPRLPLEGVRPHAEWTDTLSSTELTSGGEQRIQVVTQRRATGLEVRGGVPCIRIDVRSDFELKGGGELFGQEYDEVGTGSRSGVEFLTLDGRYFAAESRDSTRLLTNFPAQGITVASVYVVRSTVALLP